VSFFQYEQSFSHKKKKKKKNHQGPSPITDVAWSPVDSTRFATTTAAGRLDLWDLSVSSIDPVASRECGAGLSRGAFARNAPVLVCGDDQGRVHVHKIAHSKPPSLNAEQMRVRLDEAITANSEGARAVKETGTQL
jgi:WD40 repeat protein